ncbi:sigma-54-dependent Fis family transcriptional regulator [Peribacillus simplex]|uniref:Sigma-54-dependent Fis family transcriptional regulator n=1 Tax=Peribacillus simplex TaxID=1478 RepID=A0A8B5Y4I1_9BACI|nr:sigma-54-dependent Fis family transcriptional regulator [Peribacillus simplex]TVX83937.1 sigma-54-dependent Fis family transcriptional regulator [Peribacillus simplex]
MTTEYSYKEMYNRWEIFINGGNDTSHLRKEVADSWKRCKKLNVNPFKIPPIMDEYEIEEIISKNQYLINVVGPFIKLISDLTKETNFLYVLTDQNGNVIEVRGEKHVVEQAKKSNFVIGANRFEGAGTNAISVAIITGKPIHIGGPEHYNVNFHQWSCAAAPIHDSKGELRGVLTLSGHYSLKHTHTLGMVVSLAKVIEKELLFNEKNLEKEKKNKLSPKNYFTFEDIIGSGEGIQSAINLARMVSKTSTRILVEGESGTGKELFVQAIHHASERSEYPFVAVNCGAIPAQLIESELFGYHDGAFTGAKKGGMPGKFELANNGTLFLDEINSMPEDMQVKLLRVLQENEVTRVGGTTPIPINVRVIGASNESLEKLVDKKDFRRDLYYRLGIIVLQIPPLRERTEDIPELFIYLLNKICKRLNEKCPEFDPDILEYLKSFHWPGNIRELENYIERAVVLSQGKKLTMEYFPYKVIEHFFMPKKIELTSLENMEKQFIQKALDVFDGNMSKTSQLLGITRKTLYNKMKTFNLQKNSRERIL